MRKATNSKAKIGDYVVWNPDAWKLVCVSCGEPVDLMTLSFSCTVDLQHEQTVDGKYEFSGQEWDYGSTVLKCHCGVVIPSNLYEWTDGEEWGLWSLSMTLDRNNGGK